MDIQSNKICQNKKYGGVVNSDKPLNNKEISELKCFSNYHCLKPINTYSRKIYDLFINCVIFEPNINNADYIDDLYYLGTYYHFFEENYTFKKYYLMAIERGNYNTIVNFDYYYDLMKKYYLMAIERENSDAMVNLGCYYQYGYKNYDKNYDLMMKYYSLAIEKGNSYAMINLGYYYLYKYRNYDLAKEYFFMAVDKGNSDAMWYLAHYYYEAVEQNYDLAKKYYLMAIERGNSNAMDFLGLYYEHVEKNYDLMKKYFLMAINEGNDHALGCMDSYYCRNLNLVNYEDAQNYFNSVTKGCIGFNTYRVLFNKYIEENRIIDLFCLNINNIINTNIIDDIKFCLLKIVDYINSWEPYKSYRSRTYCEIKNIKHFAKYISKLLYREINKLGYKKYANELFKNKTSQLFMEYLDLYYYEYLKKIFAPGGKGYIKTKKHFELITKQQ
jgi:hypothetical protein